ncbi:AAA family ATPase [Antrihabitans sp. YC2-6]|uniref:AAA family ATPase n=1 Tax=Antrihabitans sp. YC2-6 TaxID=2799498 RepID=UPI0018F2B786|nr:AAA family ATPase [Antrihabitans sp. YC2-6]MBJ8348840.1 AAA family ATPase [Antrihabitans sp. YC2-6]
MSSVEKPLVEVVFDLADGDASLDDEAKYAVLAALDGRQALRDHLDLPPTGRTGVTALPTFSTKEPAGAFLTSIGVAGFRGIGQNATLPLHPGPGLTVVSGRNGSGKSSFAESLEFAITGGSYRWRKKSTQWTGNWRNLHHDNPCQVRIGLAVEGGEPTVLGVDWAADAGLEAAEAWVQVGNSKRQPGWDGLGWRGSVESHRPLLSYDEVGGLFEEGPSALYDALAKLLGLEAIYDAEKLLADELLIRKKPRKLATDALKELREVVAAVDDTRAAPAGALLKKRAVDLEELSKLATGVSAAPDATIGALRAMTLLPTPEEAVVVERVQRLKAALDDERRLTDAAIDAGERRSRLLTAALAIIDADGEIDCPLCGEGRLTADWRQHAAEELAEGDKLLSGVRSAQSEIVAARADVRHLISRIPSVAEIEGAALPSLARYRQAVRAFDAGQTDASLVSGAVGLFNELDSAAKDLRSEAAAELATRENRWAPVAEQIVAWIALERDARLMDPTVKVLTAAKNWVTANAAELRNQRLAPIATQARRIWAELRQESNVDLGSITLSGARTTRRAVLEASVDGQPAGALSVMSQGELHALALALFIPRATTPTSPFRFLVLDDPIQAMDPAKIDGFVRVLAGLAKTRQVIVFSHDDRLASTIRQMSVDARLVEVTRGAASTVTVQETLNRAERYSKDAFALLVDDNVPDDVKNRVAPGLFRLAIESAAQDIFYSKRYRAGVSRADAESEWNLIKTTRRRISLAVGEVPGRQGWADMRPHRKNTLRICTNGVHRGARLTKMDASDLRKSVADLRTVR